MKLLHRHGFEYQYHNHRLINDMYNSVFYELRIESPLLEFNSGKLVWVRTFPMIVYKMQIVECIRTCIRTAQLF